MDDKHSKPTPPGGDPWMADKPAESPSRDSAPGWEREAIIKLAGESLREQRRARRWGILFKGLILAYLVAVLVVFQLDFLGETGLEEGPHVALVELGGVIASDEPAGADVVNRGLRAAFKDEDTRAVILSINSPGGSPVQSGLIFDEIKRLRVKHPDTKLYAVIEDVCASGGYFVAAAADEIYANRASVIGSIGVRMDGFGFVEAIDKLGVERRLLTAGENKGLLDPFLPVQPQQVEHIQSLLNDIHRQFIDRVREGRGERLKDTPDLYTGLIWTGEQALEKGLIDAFGSTRYVAREVVGVERLVDFTPKEDLLSRIADRIGAALGTALVDAAQWRLQ